MNLGFTPFRRRLIALLAIALAVVIWPSLEHAKLDQNGYGQSQPWQSDQSTNAIVEFAAEIDSANEFAGNDGKSWLAGIDLYALVVGLAHRATADGLPPLAKHPSQFPNKTGPPSV